MGLFDKKYCDICGEKISLLGNRKLEDGNMCSHCAKGISPFMTDRRRTSVAEMKEHLAYREANRQKLSAFVVNETYGDGKKVYIDRRQNAFVVSYNTSGNWDKENPDVIPLSEVSGCSLDVRENKEEILAKDAQGNEKSYNPPRYRYDYDFYMTINVTNRWFSEITLQLNNGDVEGQNSQRYFHYQTMAQQVIGALTGKYTNGMAYSGAGTAAFAAQQAFFTAQQQNQPVVPTTPPVAPPSGSWTCPNCNAENSGAFCEYCGTKRS